MNKLSKPTSHWNKHIAGWQESGLSQVKYCKTMGLAPHRFRYWKMRILDSDQKKDLSIKAFSQVVPIKKVPTNSIADPVWVARFLKELFK